MPDAAYYIYYVYWIDNHTPRGHSSLRWSLPFAVIGEAQRWAKRKVKDGLATLAMVFVFHRDGGSGALRAKNIYPGSAQRIVAHYLDMAEHACQGVPPSDKGTS